MDTSLVFAVIGGLIGIIGAGGGMSLIYRDIGRRINNIDTNVARIESHGNSMMDKLIKLTDTEAYARGKLNRDEADIKG
jgi:hypothetical protein